ncbi:hypothetical protein [Paraburkholderia sp. J63]|uniref:hypothetical protein n=1 Tax=Paraburkholderia sp. J63 TaxID=2805434 RepID=UPI0039F44FD6
MSPVSAIPAASSAEALAHFSASLEFETDCADVLAKSVRAAFDWKSAMNQFAILFGERFTQARG